MIWHWIQVCYRTIRHDYQCRKMASRCWVVTPNLKEIGNERVFPGDFRCQKGTGKERVCALWLYLIRGSALKYAKEAEIVKKIYKMYVAVLEQADCEELLESKVCSREGTCSTRSLFAIFEKQVYLGMLFGRKHYSKKMKTNRKGVPLFCDDLQKLSS